MRIGLAQYAMGADMGANLDKALAMLERASLRQTHLVVFPELCLSPFFPQYAGQDASRYLLSMNDDPIKRFQQTCRDLGIAASPNVYLREGKSTFDASLMIDVTGKNHGVSKMVHIAQVPRFYEQDYYTPSDTGFKVYDTPHGRVGIVVCFDRHYPESIRTCAVRGASLILIPTANTIDEPRDLFECELRAAAMQNGVYLVMCNRTGPEGEMVFCGESIVVDPFGDVVAKASTGEELLIADIDLSKVEEARRKRPYLPLRRPECYE